MPIAILLLASLDLLHAHEDPQMLAILRDLSIRGAVQFDQQEVAAFIVQDANGAMSSVMWPHSAGRRSEHYEGVIPHGTVAIAHTHPPFAERPSRGDIAQAKKVGIPIFVITRWNLYAVDANGNVVALVVQKNWARSPKAAEVRAGK